MKRFVLSVRDRAADTFGQPFFVASIGQGIRSFTDEVNRQAADNVLANHPEDFDLYVLAEFDDASGVFTNEERPRQVAIGKDVRAA